MEFLIMDSVLGHLKLVEDNGFLVEIRFTYEDLSESNSPFLLDVKKQLNEYFKGLRRKFNINLKLDGTDFQKNVWKALIDIPYGEVCSYKDIAEKVGSPKAFRAVGNANNRNKIPIVIPCHRVIGSNGKLVGYDGGIEIKEKLLNLEKSFK